MTLEDDFEFGVEFGGRPVVESDRYRLIHTDLKPEKRVLAFTWNEPMGAWHGQPFTWFRPNGILLWGISSPEPTIECKIRAHMQIQASYAAVPALFFACGESFEQVAKKMAEGYEPAGWCTFHPIEPQARAEIIINHNGNSLGPRDGVNIVMWGFAAMS